MQNVPRKPRRWRRSLLAWARRQKFGDVIERAQIIRYATVGAKAADIAELIGCARSHVYRTVHRFLSTGRLGLFDRRKVPRPRLATLGFMATVRELVPHSPQDYNFARPTWTRELLILVAEEQTGIRVSLTTMSRVLQRIRARRGRPKPIVRCPLSDRQKRRRLQKIRELIAHAPSNEVVVFEDEVDIHLNPKIGLDWMPRGVQKVVVTPGQNEKAYLAGTLDARDGTILWVGDTRKNSALFVQMLKQLTEHYAGAKQIHVILDNYGIHRSHETRAALRLLPRIRLHFLPPYCPDDNRIERLWGDLHANVTRNHRHTNLLDLCQDVVAWLSNASPWPSERPRSEKPLQTGNPVSGLNRLAA